MRRRMIPSLVLGAACAAMTFAGVACKDNTGEKETTAAVTEVETENETEKEIETEKETEGETNAEVETELSTEDVDTGWRTDEKGKYFLIDGERQTGIVDLTEYAFDSGIGLTAMNAYCYAFDEDGYLYPEGWLELDGDTYYVREDGLIPLASYEIDGVTYLFNEEGKLSTGIRFMMLENDFYVCYFSKEGRVESDWATIGKTTPKTLYFDEDGRAVSGWQTIDGKKYFFGVDSDDALASYIMATGKVKIGDEEYEFGEDGVLKE